MFPPTLKFEVTALLCHSHVGALIPSPKKKCIFSFGLTLEILLLLQTSSKMMEIQFGIDILYMTPVLPAPLVSAPNKQ